MDTEQGGGWRRLSGRNRRAFENNVAIEEIKSSVVRTPSQVSGRSRVHRYHGDRVVDVAVSRRVTFGVRTYARACDCTCFYSAGRSRVKICSSLRTTMSSSTAPSTREAHSSLYFPHGDIILEAKPGSSNPSSPSILFRVHRWLLAHHSPVFRDMFSMPYPRTEAKDDIYDGAPVVEMTDDAQDLESLLCILYDPS